MDCDAGRRIRVAFLPMLLVGASALCPATQSWRFLSLVAIAGVGVMTLAIRRLTP
jgi:hypothetical protein